MGLSFVEGLLKASSMILVSEVGDKTFFVAALMAMRHPRRFVLAGSLAALWTMTCLSALFGWAAPTLIPRQWTSLLATILFLVFGLRSLWDGLTMVESRASQELKEVEEELDRASQASHGTSVNGVAVESSQTNSADTNDVDSKQEKAKRQWLQRIFSPIFLQAFSLVFLGEWGDKSQIATIGLAAEENVFGVALGGCLGHAICSGAAVIGGRHLATKISERTVSLCGGTLFLLFALHSLIYGH